MTRSQNRILGAVIRVSRVAGRDEGGERFQSPKQQIDECRRVAERLGFEIEVFDADAQGQGVPGSTPYEERPGMSAALKAVEDGRLAGVIVSALDRLVREDAEKGVTLKGFQRRIRDAGAMLVVPDSPDASIDDPDAEELVGTERIGLGVRLLVDATYREEAGKKWAKAKIAAIERGVCVSRAPVGYTKIEDKNRPDDDGRLEVDPAVGPYITEAFVRRARGATYESIAAYFNQKGVEKPTRRERGEDGALVEAEPVPWEYRQIMDILSRPVYLGRVQGTVKDKLYEALPGEEHEALVDQETWHRVRARNGKPATKTDSAKGTHLLTGYIRCAGCGRAMSYSKSTARGKDYFFCRCKRSSCTAKAGIAPRELEPYVVGVLAEAVTAEVERPRKNTERLAKARARVEQAEAEYVDFEQGWRSADINAFEAGKVLTGLSEKIEEARQALTDIPTEDEDILFTGVPAILVERAKARGFGGGTEIHPDTAVLDLLKESATKDIEQGLTGHRLLLELLFDTEGLEPDAVEEIRRYQRSILKRYLSKVVVSGSRGPAEGRVEVELK